MRIGLNLLYLIPQQVGGTQTYAEHLVGALAEEGPQHEYCLFVNSEGASLPWPRSPNFRTVVSRFPPRLRSARYAHEQLVLPRRLRKESIDVVHSLGYVSPLHVSCASVVSIHDALHVGYPMSAARRALLGFFVTRSARRCDRVITVSEFSKRELVEVLGVRPERVRVVPSGVEERFSPETEWDSARRRLGLGPRPYALALGSRIGRKNLGILRLAARRLAAVGVELVTAGSGRGYMRAGEGPPGRALGYVPDELMPGLYAGARALVLPSLYEGFGLPCLEAMASGTPVVASDRTALPEVCGGAALLVNPEDEHAVAAALVAAASEPAVREPLIAAGLAHATGHRWRRSAELTDQVMSELLDG